MIAEANLTRSGVQDGNNSTYIVPHVMWCVLFTHRVMEQLIKHSFKYVPGIAAIQTRLVMENSPIKQLREMDKKPTSFHKTQTRTNSQIDSLNSQLKKTKKTVKD